MYGFTTAVLVFIVSIVCPPRFSIVVAFAGILLFVIACTDLDGSIDCDGEIDNDDGGDDIRFLFDPDRMLVVSSLPLLFWHADTFGDDKEGRPTTSGIVLGRIWV